MSAQHTSAPSSQTAGLAVGRRLRLARGPILQGAFATGLRMNPLGREVRWAFLVRPLRKVVARQTTAEGGSPRNRCGRSGRRLDCGDRPAAAAAAATVQGAMWAVHHFRIGALTHFTIAQQSGTAWSNRLEKARLPTCTRECMARRFHMQSCPEHPSHHTAPPKELGWRGAATPWAAMHQPAY